jgi:hypothetical protein
MSFLPKIPPNDRNRFGRDDQDERRDLGRCDRDEYGDDDLGHDSYTSGTTSRIILTIAVARVGNFPVWALMAWRYISTA